MQMKDILKVVASCTFIACLTLYGDLGTVPVNAKETKSLSALVRKGQKLLRMRLKMRMKGIQL